MEEYFHSVRLLSHRCQGCVNCIKRCPTEAIRIREGKACITEERCIDCGECIRRCPNHAKGAITDKVEDLKRFKYNIALPAPSFYAQFDINLSINKICEALKLIGFDEVYDVAHGAELVSLAIKDLLTKDVLKKPAISSACPAVVRLIQVKYPELLENIVPVDAPINVSASTIKRLIKKKYNYLDSEIGIWFITPCPAKMTAIRQPLSGEKSNISGAIAFSQIYALLKKVLPQICENEERHSISALGLGWAVAGGESAMLPKENVLVVDGIHSVSNLLEQLTLGKIKDVDYLECLACSGGCIGGPLTIENRFTAENRMRKRKKAKEEEKTDNYCKINHVALESMYKELAIEPRSMMKLDEDIFKAMHKVDLIEKTVRELPGLDCGSCGSPNCKALAEDIVQGIATETDCVFKLRERVKNLAQEMVSLAQKLPPSLATKNKE